MNKELEKTLRWLQKNRIFLVSLLAAFVIIQMFFPSFAGNPSTLGNSSNGDFFDIARVAFGNIANRLTSVYIFGLFPAAVVICGCIIGFSKDPRTVEMAKQWLIRAIIALVICAGYKIFIKTLKNVLNNSDLDSSIQEDYTGGLNGGRGNEGSNTSSTTAAAATNT